MQQIGIVFIDEMTRSAPVRGARWRCLHARASSETLLPLIEGTTVSTKYGAVKTDHILFIA